MNTKKLLLVGAVLLGSLGVYSCNKKEMAAGADLVKKEYSGEELFRGIFFVEGEVASRINFFELSYENIQDLSEDKKISYHQYVDLVVEKIHIEYPTLLSNLQDVVKSKDLLQIEKIYQDTREKVEFLMSLDQNQNYEAVKAAEQAFTILACSKRIGKGCVVYSWGKNGLDVLTKLQRDILITEIANLSK